MFVFAVPARIAQINLQSPSSPVLALVLWNSLKQECIDFPANLTALRQASLKTFENLLNNPEQKLDFYYFERHMVGSQSNKVKMSSEADFVYFRSCAHLSNFRVFVWDRKDNRSPPTSPFVLRPNPIDVSRPKQKVTLPVPSPVSDPPVSANRDSQMRECCLKRDFNPETKEPWCVFCGGSPGVTLLVACHLIPHSVHERFGLVYPLEIGHTESGLNGVFGCDPCHKLWDSYRFVAALQPNGDLLLEVDCAHEDEYGKLKQLKGMKVRRPQLSDESIQEQSRVRIFPPDEAWKWRMDWYKAKQLKREQSERSKEFKEQRKEEKTKRNELKKTERALKNLVLHQEKCFKCKSKDSNQSCTNPEGKHCAPCYRLSRQSNLIWQTECGAEPHRKQKKSKF